MVGTGSRRVGTAVGGLVAGTVASAALAGVLLLHVWRALSDHVGPWQVDAVTEVAVTAAGALVAAWLAAGALLTTVCVVVRAGGASWRAGERLVHRYAPRVVRKALVLAVGAGIGLGMATGASAAAPEPSATAATTAITAPDDLGWSVTTTAATGATAQPDDTAAALTAEADAGSQTTEPVSTPAAPPAVVEATSAAHPATPVPASAGTAPGTYVVAAGDSLWAIAARHLPPGATDAQIADAWPRWYQANSAVVGADPDLVRPGQVLTAPATTGEPTL